MAREVTQHQLIYPPPTPTVMTSRNLPHPSRTHHVHQNPDEEMVAPSQTSTAPASQRVAPLRNQIP